MTRMFSKWLIFAFLFIISPMINAITLSPEKIKVVTEYLEPYQIQNPDGSLGGFSVDVVQALFKHIDKTPNFNVMSWARAYAVAKAEKNVMIFSIAHTPARDDLFQWVGSLTEERLYFWGLKTQFSEQIDNIEILKELKIAVSRYSNAAQYLIDNNFYNIYQLIKEDQNMLMLYKGRVDLIVATKLTLQKRAKKLGLNFDDLQLIKEVNELNNDLSIAFNLNSDPVLVKKFQQGFEDIRKNGTLANIVEKWKINDE